MKRQLAPLTKNVYARALTRAFGDTLSVSESVPPAVILWPRSSKIMLRAALQNVGRLDLADQIEIPYAIDKVPQIPSEEEAKAYEYAVQAIPRGIQAIALLPLKLGLRAQEMLQIERTSIISAIKTGELKILRKGGKEAVLPATKIKPLLEEILTVPAKAPRITLKSKPQNTGKRTWEVIGKALSLGGPEAQYHALYRLIKLAGKLAGINVRPHLLRHAFATRMNRDGATAFTIQAALGHMRISTTQRYIHVNVKDIDQYLRE